MSPVQNEKTDDGPTSQGERTADLQEGTDQKIGGMTSLSNCQETSSRYGRSPTVPNRGVISCQLLSVGARGEAAALED